MILYFANRQLTILGQASTSLPNGLVVSMDKKTEDVDVGSAIFECEIDFDDDTRSSVESYTAVGNYLFRSNGDEQELYTIIETELDTKKRKVYVYAEDAGMDLLNEVVGKYEADIAYPISHYITMFAAGSGFTIKTNEIKSYTLQLAFDNECTAMERLLDIAKQFECEIGFSFRIDGLKVTKKYINIYSERGKEQVTQLRLNYEIDNIVTTKSIANIATALQCTGGTPEDSEDPITLSGYAYDDGDFYVSGNSVVSRTAYKKWSRLLWKDDGSQESGGQITKQFSFDTLSKATLCAEAIKELKKIRDTEVNYEAEIPVLPSGVRIGDRINIIDDAGGLYLSARLLKVVTSVVDNTRDVVLGDYLLRKSGISQKVIKLAEDFSKTTVSVKRAMSVAKTAKASAESALSQVEDAMASVEEAQKAVADVVGVVDDARQAAADAQTAANNAQAVVDNIEEDMEGMAQSVANAQAAAEQARQAAATAETKATEAYNASVQAQSDAAEAKEAVETATTAAGEATAKAKEAKTAADKAQEDAEAAATTALAAKVDAERAQREIDALDDNLTTLENTMSVEYSRKTDLTEARADLQSQVTQNAAQIGAVVSKQQIIDETANNAREQLDGAQKWAETAQAQADVARAYAEETQAAAEEAQLAADAATTKAETAQTAADTAKQEADRAEADLRAAEEDLASIESRADATEEEIEAARAVVDSAQVVADEADAIADAAMRNAAQAQETAYKATAQATKAQAVASEALKQANTAQSVADAAKGDATEAQRVADEAAVVAQTALDTANAAVQNATATQAMADILASEAASANANAEDAQARASEAAAYLATAQQELEDILARADATEEEVAEAQAFVEQAQASADEAASYAQATRATATQAQADAEQAQIVADEAQLAADTAQAEAKEAQAAADAAKAVVDGLAVRIEQSETKILQNTEQITLSVKKAETELKESEDGLRSAINEQNTSIIQDCNTILLSALESYVKTGDYEEYKSTVQSSLELLTDKVAINLTRTEENKSGIDDLQSDIATYSKHFEFTENGLVIKAGESTIELMIDNDMISFRKNGEPFGWWDGVDFHTGNIVVKVEERAQFGNFAFLPRSDGSLQFLKVGG
jgi:phage minor structural protein